MARTQENDDFTAARNSRTARIRKALAIGAVALASAAPAAATADEQIGIQVGSLTCQGDGGWSVVIGSSRSFDCTFATIDGALRDAYTGTIQRVGLDLGMTSDTALTWAVIGPAGMTGDSFERGSLGGDFVGVGAEAAMAVGGGVHVLVGGHGKAFTLQPVSVQVETGVSLAAGVEKLELTYKGPIE